MLFWIREGRLPICSMISTVLLKEVGRLFLPVYWDKTTVF
jgi:hypothetical protein